MRTTRLTDSRSPPQDGEYFVLNMCASWTGAFELDPVVVADYDAGDTTKTGCTPGVSGCYRPLPDGSRNWQS